MIALLAGVLFGAGLAVSGMMQPEKVIGFLDIAKNWDASLMLVMGGALAVFTWLSFLGEATPTRIQWRNHSFANEEIH